jgi:hypothetical protein
VPRQLLRADRAQQRLDLVRDGSAVGHDVGHRPLAEHVVDRADHRGRADAGLREQDLFDLPGVDLLPAPVDHVVGPPDEEQVAVLVQVAEVAGVQPAVIVDRAGPPAGGVRGDHAATADQHPPDVGGRAGPADAHLRPGWLPGRAGLAWPVERVGRDHAGCLGHAVGLDDRHADGLLEPLKRGER